MFQCSRRRQIRNLKNGFRKRYFANWIQRWGTVFTRFWARKISFLVMAEFWEISKISFSNRYCHFWVKIKKMINRVNPRILFTNSPLILSKWSLQENYESYILYILCRILKNPRTQPSYYLTFIQKCQFRLENENFEISLQPNYSSTDEYILRMSFLF